MVQYGSGIMRISIVNANTPWHKCGLVMMNRVQSKTRTLHAPLHSVVTTHSCIKHDTNTSRPVDFSCDWIVFMSCLEHIDVQANAFSRGTGGVSTVNPLPVIMIAGTLLVLSGIYGRGQKKLTLRFRATENFTVFVSFLFYRFVVSFLFLCRLKTWSTDGSPVKGVLERLHTITIAMSLH